MNPYPLIIAAAAAALCAPSAASAATLAYEGDTLVYRAAAGEQNFANLSTEEGRSAWNPGRRSTTAPR